MTLNANEYTVREMLVPIFKAGKCVYTSPSVMDIRAYCIQELDTLWDEHKRLINPQIMFVDLSQELYDLKKALIDELRR
jgi:nicotinate phosphoribosyltransferase